MSEQRRRGRRGAAGARLAQFTRLAYRKLIFRRADFIECGAAARDHREPTTPTTLAFDVVGPDGYDAMLTASPHLAQKDIDHFRTADTRLMVVLDDTAVAAMNWFVRGPGDVWISELRRSVPLAAGEHYSCRTYVDDAYRGRALAELMIYRYSETLEPSERIWGIVMTRNKPSLRFLARLGWQATGTWTAVVRFGRFTARHQEHLPRMLPT